MFGCGPSSATKTYSAQVEARRADGQKAEMEIDQSIVKTFGERQGERNAV